MPPLKDRLEIYATVLIPQMFIIAICFGIVTVVAVTFGSPELRQAGYDFGGWIGIGLGVLFPPFVAIYVWAARRHLRAKREKAQKWTA